MKKLKYVLLVALAIGMASCDEFIVEPRGEDDPVVIPPPPPPPLDPPGNP